MKILLIEDEQSLAETMRDFLLGAGYVVEWAPDFPSASEKIALYSYDCLVVDINLPGGGNGLELVRNLRKEHPETGVILISARDALSDRITGLDLGADDYLTKPFHLAELNARLRALLRRRQLGGNTVLTFQEISVQPSQRSVWVHDNLVVLTPKEYDLLLYLMVNARRVLSRENIAEHLLGDDADQMDDFDFLYSHVKNLRKKLLDQGCGDYLRAVYGIGYKFDSVKL